MRAVWIGACSRSGTTMLGALLGSHSQAVAVPEAQFKIDALRGPAGATDPGRSLDRILSHWRFKIWGVPVDRGSLVPGQEEPGYSDLIEGLVRAYARTQGRPEAQVWVDHTPSNIRFASTLFELFPQSKMVHLVRDGRAVAASLLPLSWGPNTIMRAAEHWLENLGCGLAAEAAFGPDRVMRVRYEDLLVAPERTLSSLCAFLDLELEPEMLTGSRFAVPAYTRHQHELVGKGIDASRREAWRNRLDARQIEIFEALTGDTLEYLGYERMFGIAARLPTPREQLKMRLYENLRHYLRNVPRHRLQRVRHSRSSA